jgi:hypothetical protein
MEPKNYNRLTPVQRRTLRLEYEKHQGGKCCHCQNLLTEQPAQPVLGRYIDKKLFPPYFFKHKVHLHHCHRTGQTIGAVHAKCNAYLWQYHGV